ncbi:DEAD/DEAH box helicase [Clostridium algidicarnis]|uniref:DEAD/DEAH box helicase n=1 Tax=Clostridium algidicarnis TaxID=37659 RepID=UPI001FACAB27|nr:DEAD/DEAH box helicase [Clostridium algidicarnis]
MDTLWKLPKELIEVQLMIFSFDDNDIKDLLGDIVYNTGLDMYYRNKVRKIDVLEDSQNTFSVISTVESAYDLKDYKVNILTNRRNGAMYSSCNCLDFTEYGKCKHIAAVFIKINREGTTQKSRMRELLKDDGSELLNYYRQESKDNYKANELINMEALIEINDDFYKPYALELKVGLERLYVVKNLKEFIESVFLNEQSIYFGKGFEFYPKTQYFSKEDYEVLLLIKEIYDNNNHVNANMYVNKSIFFSGKRAYLTESQLIRFLRLKSGLKINAILKGKDYKNINVFTKDIPLNFNISMTDDVLSLKLNEGIPESVDRKNKIYMYKEDLYLPSKDQIKSLMPIYKTMKKQGSNNINFKKSEISEVATYIIPKLRLISESIIADESLESIIKEETLEISFYLDKDKEYVSCDVVFKYGDTSFDLKDKDEDNKAVVVIRKLDEENIALRTLENMGFEKENNKYYLKDEDMIIDFVIQGIGNISSLGEVYYSDSFKNIQVMSSKSFKSSISLNNANLLEFDFEVEGMDKSELKSLFNSLKQRKKYYKLKNGDILPLNSGEIQDFNLLMQTLDIDTDKLSKGKVTLPKYASLYIDENIKANNLNFISKNKTFEDLVNAMKDIKNSNYELPKGITGNLRDYQKIGFKWFKTLSYCDFGGILGDEMGLGKTFQAISYIASEKEEGALNTPALIVCPTSLVYNWLSEFEKFAPNLQILVVSGSKNERLIQREGLLEYDVIITSYPLIRRDIEEYNDIIFSICILDEAQQIKNPSSLNAQSVKELKAQKRFALTGTPIENSLTELWSIFDFIMPGYLKTQGRFSKKFEIPIVKDKDEIVLKELLKLIRPFILRRFKRDVALELPEKIEHKVIVDMTEEQKKLYVSYVNSFKEEIKEEIKEKGFNRSKIKILSLLTRLRQICCDPSSFLDNYTGDSGKYITLDEILEESLSNGHRVLLFSQFTTILKSIKERLDKSNIKSMYLDGSVPSKKRMGMVNEFNEGDAQVFLISLKAGGTGLNLTGADLVIHFDPWWNPAVEDQAVDRAHRIGQTKTVEVIKLITKGTIEEKIYDLQEKKKEIIKSVLDGENHDKVLLSTMTEEDMEDLFKI